MKFLKQGFAVVCAGMLTASTVLSSSVYAQSTTRTGLNQSTISLLDRYVDRYEDRDMESRMRIAQGLDRIIMMIQDGEVRVSGSQQMILTALMYLDLKFEAIDDGSMMEYTQEQQDAIDYLMSDGLMLEMQLGLLLKEHVDLGLNTLRNLYDETDDFQASFDQLDANTNALADAIGMFYGDDARENFDELWTAHIGFFADYAVGLRDNDASMVRQAREDLQGYVEDIDAFFSSAIPSIMRGDLEAGANMHQALLLESLSAYDDGDYDEAYELQREAHTQIGELAHALAMGMVKQFDDMYDEMDLEAIRSNSGGLLKTMNNLFIEHVTLGLDVLRSAADGSDDFQAAFDALDDNTNDLADAVGSIYGDDAKEAFDELWTNHITFFANYVTAVETGDMDMKEQAEMNLMQYSKDVDALFSEAIPTVMPGDVMAGAKAHKDFLLASIDAYADDDYDDAYRLQRESTKQVTGLGQVLVPGIVKQFPGMFEGLMDK